MGTDVLLGFIAGLIHFFGSMIYLRKMLKGTSHPNTATWTIWLFTSVLNCASYVVMTQDWVKGLLPIASASAVLVTFILSCLKGRLSKLDTYDAIALTIGLLSMLGWCIFHSATFANLILQLCFIISIIPTYRGVLKNKNTEDPLPWFVWSLGYLLIFILVLIRWHGQYQDLAYPLNCLISHSGIGILTLRKK